ncbi:unnamed protein product [Pieris macdunnoughi]|uniref:Uncharacterized protein n=1 Tax=Pieris macdunnoughi TaxID=345717 RepID=A0A821VLB0_9NEOP|nr:unnamed protein product [Pieris macdunnoughi]
MKYVLKGIILKVISNEQIWELCQETPINQQIKGRKWIGHTLQKVSNDIPKHGRPIPWRFTVASDAKRAEKTWSEKSPSRVKDINLSKPVN